MMKQWSSWEHGTGPSDPTSTQEGRAQNCLPYATVVAGGEARPQEHGHKQGQIEERSPTCERSSVSPSAHPGAPRFRPSKLLSLRHSKACWHWLSLPAQPTPVVHKVARLTKPSPTCTQGSLWLDTHTHLATFPYRRLGAVTRLDHPDSAPVGTT